MEVNIAIRQRIVEEALTWLHTPYRDLQSCKGAGCDCVGYPSGVAKNVGLLDPLWRPKYYSPQWHLHQSDELLLRTLEELGCRERTLEDREPGDILVFHIGRACSHCAIFMPDNNIIHAVVNREVVMHRLIGSWKNVYLKHCYTFPGVE